MWVLNNLWLDFSPFFSYSVASVHQQLPASSRPHHSPADRPLLPPGTHLQAQRANGPPSVGFAAEKSQPDVLFCLWRWWVSLRHVSRGAQGQLLVHHWRTVCSISCNNSCNNFTVIIPRFHAWNSLIHTLTHTLTHLSHKCLEKQEPVIQADPEPPKHDLCGALMELCTDPCDVMLCIIMLLFTISLCRLNTINKMHLCVLSMPHTCLFHYPSTAMGHYIQNVDVNKLLTRMMPYTLSSTLSGANRDPSVNRTPVQSVLQQQRTVVRSR